MGLRPPRHRAILVCALFLGAEIFAFAPLLHPQTPGVRCAADACSWAMAGRAGREGSRRGAAPAALSAASLRTPGGPCQAPQECPACRLASLVMVAQGGPPLALPLPRPAAAAAAPARRRCWLSLDSTYGRAPPRA